jgi:hypothetical protein
MAFQEEPEIMSFDHLENSQLPLLVEDLEDLVHDLGKYMVFETRMLTEDASDSALLGALRTDLYETRKRTDSNGVVVTETAWSVWDRLRPSALNDVAEVAQIDKLMSELRQVELEESNSVLNKVRTQTQEVRTLLKMLLSRVRKEEEGR